MYSAILIVFKTINYILTLPLRITSWRHNSYDAICTCNTYAGTMSRYCVHSSYPKTAVLIRPVYGYVRFKRESMHFNVFFFKPYTKNWPNRTLCLPSDQQSILSRTGNQSHQTVHQINTAKTPVQYVLWYLKHSFKFKCLEHHFTRPLHTLRWIKPKLTAC